MPAVFTYENCLSKTISGYDNESPSFQSKYVLLINIIYLDANKIKIICLFLPISQFQPIPWSGFYSNVILLAEFDRMFLDYLYCSASIRRV